MEKYKIKGINQKKKSNLLFMLLVIFLISVILCISSFGIATWARYRSVIGSNVEAQIAKWSFKVNGEEEQFADIDLADTIDFTHVTTDKIAPGTYGSFDLDIDGRGSEVSLDYYIDMVVAQKPTNMKFYLDSNYSQPIEIAVGNKMFLEGDLLLSENPMQEIRTIYWKWDYRTAIMPSQAVLNAYSSVIPGLEALITEYDNASGVEQEEIAMKINDKIDTQEAGGQVIVNVKVKGVQINPNFSLKRVQVTSAKDDVYQAGDTVNFSMEFTENVYGDSDKGSVTSSNAPEVTVGFGGTSANNPVAKVASLIQTNLKLSEGENVATFVSASGNKINYSYTLQSGDRGAFRIVSITGTVYNGDRKQINFGTVQSPTTAVPEIVGGTVTTEAPVIVPIGGTTPTPVVTPISSTLYGQYVDIGTNILGDLNSITLSDNSHPLSDWRVFKSDSNGTILILSALMPNSEIPSDTGLITSSTYTVYGSTRQGLLQGLESENWNSLLNNTSLYGKNGVTVKGAIEIEDWVTSWNDSGYKTIYTDGLKVGDSENSINEDCIVLSGLQGFNDTLYFPYAAETLVGDCFEYWIASLNECNSDCLYDISWGSNYWNAVWGVDAERYFRDFVGVRPVIYIPSNVQFNTSNSVWTIAN